MVFPDWLPATREEPRPRGIFGWKGVNPTGTDVMWRRSGRDRLRDGRHGPPIRNAGDRASVVANRGAIRVAGTVVTLGFTPHGRDAIARPCGRCIALFADQLEKSPAGIDRSGPGERVMSETTRCPKCETAVPASNRFCPGCGEAVAAPEGRAPLRWKWVAIGAAAIVAVQGASGVLIGLAAGAHALDMNRAESLLLLLSIMAATYLLTGAGVAYASPGRTLREPAVGAVLAITAVNLAAGNAASLGGPGMVGMWLVPFGLTMLGARIGERLQSRAQPRSAT
jgi:hypothetical protein